MKNIFHKITWQSLKKNRARTIVTIIGVILSAAMITAVTTFIASLQNSLIQAEIAVSGGWHVKFTDVDPAFIAKITADKEVESVATVKTENSDNSSGYDALVTLKSPGKVYRYAEKTAGGASYEYNRALLRLYGVSANDGYNRVLYSLGGILIALIMVGSVLLIYNSFAISVSERSRQFGILVSVGATKKQLRKSVLFEGVCIGAIGIPLGIAAGIGGIGVTLHLISDITKYMFSGAVPLTLSLSWPSIAVAAAVSAATILISAYIPARRAFSQSAIDIIRQSGDVKIKANEVRTSKLAGLLFGLEGTLALKNFKRSRKRYRSTVISLFVSVTLFIAASAFGMYIRQGTEMTIGDYGFDLAFGVSQGSYHLGDEELLRLYDRMNGASGVTAGAYTTSLPCVGYVSASEFSEEFLQNEVGGIVEIPDGGRENSAARVHVTLRFVDDATYGKYLDALGLSAAEYGVENGKLPAVAKKTGYDSDLQRTVALDVFQNSSVTMPVTPASAPAGDAYPAMDITFTFAAEIPDILFQTYYYGVTAFAPYSAKSLFPAPEEDYSGITMNFSSADPWESAAEMQALIAETDAESGYALYNAAEALAQNRNILLVINIFTYGFVILISLITVANVFNTVSTGIKLRRRELAMLRSVGMSSRGFARMMSFECLFYGLKALLYGLPASAGITYLIYRAVLGGVDVPFTLPWRGIAVSAGGVFLIVFVTMIYAVRGIKNANVIEALRDELS
ncbi:MAG: ABC transporter permease [Gracilibacteraceae bacterium]|nr:ABC transporter permease [Gracilibacteraceae bacterium]